MAGGGAPIVEPAWAGAPVIAGGWVFFHDPSDRMRTLSVADGARRGVSTAEPVLDAAEVFGAIDGGLVIVGTRGPLV